MLKNWHGQFLCYYRVVEDIYLLNIYCLKHNLGLRIMQKIYIHSWLDKKYPAAGVIQSADNELELDFSNVDEICLKDIEKLLDLQKLAVFNEIKLHVENMKPNISRVFEQTGLYKMLTFGSSQKFQTRKRQGLAFE